ncbi:MAG: thrombospondin type 3 repeat-containing protein [Thermoplasmatota archaeon]
MGGRTWLVILVGLLSPALAALGGVHLTGPPAGPVVLAGSDAYLFRSNGNVTVVDRFDLQNETIVTLPTSFPANLSGAAAAWDGKSITLLGVGSPAQAASFSFQVATGNVTPIDATMPGPGGAAWFDNGSLLAAGGCHAPCPILRQGPDGLLHAVANLSAAVEGSLAWAGDGPWYLTASTPQGPALWQYDGASKVTLLAHPPLPTAASAFWTGCQIGALGTLAGSQELVLFAPGSTTSTLIPLSDSGPGERALYWNHEAWIFGTAGGNGISVVPIPGCAPPGAPPAGPAAPAPAADRDHDGVPDIADNCPDIPNHDQKDSDGDGVGDECDPTPCLYDALRATAADAANRSLPAAPCTVGAAASPAAPLAPPPLSPLRDADHDGIPDGADNCPTVPNHDQADLDGDGIGDVCDLDMDGDGINDKLAPGDPSLTILDNCPRAYNPDQKDSDRNGVGDVCQASVLPPPVRMRAVASIAVAHGSSVGIVLVAAAGTLAVVGAVWLGPRLRRLAPAAALLFSRLKEEDLLEHPQRAAIFGVIQASPGIHYQGILRQLSLTRGVLEHHLHILERADLVKAHRWKGTIGYYLAPGPSMAQRTATAVLRSPLARRIHTHLRAAPNATVASLAQALGVPYAAVSYHVKRFRDAGLLKPLDEGRYLFMDSALEAEGTSA